MADQEDASAKSLWISEKVAKLIEEGKEAEQATAIAHSMWEEKQKDACAKKKDSHVDYSDWDFESQFEETPEGFLMGRAVVTNIGVFSYLNPDGTVRRELRLPEEVFKQESLDSYIGKSVTNNHPMEFVDTDNFKDLEIGTMMGPINRDAFHVSAGIVIKNKDAIQQIKNGKTALSCGYNLDLDWTPGTWMGVPYDCIQRNIRINHVALVDKARAGDAAKIRMDGADRKYCVQIMEEDSMADKALRTINLDNVDYQAEDAVIEAYKEAKERADGIQANLDKLTAEKSAIEAERDSLKQKVDSAEKEVADLKAKSVDAAEVEKKVKARLTLLEVARKAKIEKAEDMDDGALTSAVIMSQFPKTELTGKNADYVQAMFDISVKNLEEKANADAASGTRELNADTAGASGSKLSESRKKMILGYGKRE